jgi:ribosomal protein S27AE
MYLPWRAREFERTCAKCGYVWPVPRQFARRHFQSISGVSSRVPRMRGNAFDPRGPDFSELNAEVRAIEDSNEEFEAFRTCPRCSSRQFAQRVVRRAP